MARLFGAWCRAFVRALGVDLRLHQKNRKRLPARYILIANHPSAFEDIGIPALFDVVSLAKVQVADWFVVGASARRPARFTSTATTRNRATRRSRPW